MIVALFVFKIDRTLYDPALTLQRRDFILVEDEFVLLYLIFFLFDVCLKKQNTLHDAAWKALQVTMNSYEKVR